MSKIIQEYGNLLKVQWEDDVYFAYPTAGGLWIVKSEKSVDPNPDPDPDPTDPTLPGYTITDNLRSDDHYVTNPGGTIKSGWDWHIENSGGRGGVDLRYDFEDFKAPASGTVTHFNVPGVGMVVRLKLDHWVSRKHPKYTNEPEGPIKAIWFQHCSASKPNGHYDKGDIIGTSGNGGGLYAPHLHVHGMSDIGSVASASNRLCMWNFIA